MSSISPASVLYSSDGYELAVVQNAAIPTGTRSILMSGSDGTNSRPFLVDSSGRPVIVGAGVAGTPAGGVVTIQGISGGTVVPVSGNGNFNNASVSTTGAAPPASATYIGGSVTTAAPAYTTGQMSALSLTTTGLLRVDGSGVTQPIAGTGTAGTANAGVVTIQGIAGMTAVSVTGTGNFNNASVSATGAAPPASATYIGGSVTTAAPAYTTGQMSALSLTTTGLLRVDNSGVTQPVSGTVTVAQATAANLNATVVGTGTDNTTNSTAKLPVIPAVATTAAPTYTSGNMVPLSVDTSGNLRVTGTVTATNASVGSDAAAFLASDTQVGGKVTTAAPTLTTGNLGALSLTTLGGLRVDGIYAAGTANATAADTMVSGGYVTTAAPTYTTGQLNPLSLTTAGLLRVDGTGGTFNNSATSATGATTPTSASLAGTATTTAAPTYTTGQMNPLSTTTGGLLRVDGVYPINATTPTTDVTFVGGAVTTAAPTYTTGQLSALSLTTAGALRVDGSGSTQPVSGTVTSNQGTAGTAAQGWFSKITDGTNTAAVKAASTAPVATDPALVVALSPNTAPLKVITDSSATSAITTVAGSTSNTSVLASNAARVLATVFNGTNKLMYLALGATASTSSYTIQIMPSSYWELPLSYTGAISAVWASGVSGNALVTELT